MGDSWDSGVAYSNDVTYDGNKGFCLRFKDSWSAQMASDDSWTTDGQHLTWTGCSGALFKDIVNVDVHGNPPQMSQHNKSTLITMSDGGNDCGFGAIVDNCVYHGVPGKDYGPPFHSDPDGKGSCKQSIATSGAYIDGKSTGLASDLRNTIDDVFREAKKSGRDIFNLYINGYAQFFNTETTECDGWSFAPPYVIFNKPRLTLELRKTLNDNVEKLNNVYVRNPSIHLFGLL